MMLTPAVRLVFSWKPPDGVDAGSVVSTEGIH